MIFGFFGQNNLCSYVRLCIGKNCFILLLLIFPMGAVHERKKLVSLADVANRSGVPSSDVQGYDQLGFEGLDHAEKQEVTIENLQVVKLPQVKKIGRKRSSLMPIKMYLYSLLLIWIPLPQTNSFSLLSGRQFRQLHALH